jgi:hypothetical protein
MPIYLTTIFIMKEKKVISQELIGPKESTLSFLKGFSAQFYSAYSKNLGPIFISNN